MVSQRHFLSQYIVLPLLLSQHPAQHSASVYSYAHVHLFAGPLSHLSGDEKKKKKRRRRRRRREEEREVQLRRRRRRRTRRRRTRTTRTSRRTRRTRTSRRRRKKERRKETKKERKEEEEKGPSSMTLVMASHDFECEGGLTFLHSQTSAFDRLTRYDLMVIINGATVTTQYIRQPRSALLH